ncbi:MAG: dihydroorotate dehydrogenase electron transfer subunit [Pseudomonadota bacterium]
MFEQYAEIAFNDRLTPDTWVMGLRSAEIAGRAKPGQFVMIRVRSGVDPLLRRPFSICGVKEDLFLVLYRVVGRGTAIMTEAGGGQELKVLGPLGKAFEAPKTGKRCLLVGGGIGVAPLFFLAQSLKERKFQFLMGFRSVAEIISLDHAVGRKGEVLIATDDGTEGHVGFVTDLLEMALEGSRAQKRSIALFTCGPKPMLRRVAQMAADRKISCQASLEATMACGLGACQGCAVKAASKEERPYYHVCQEGPVFPREVIDWDRL